MSIQNTGKIMVYSDPDNKNTWYSPIMRTMALLFILITVISFDSYGQSKITFKINLTPQLEDSVFIPDRDKIYLKGDVFPLSSSQKVYMKDTAPVDSVYEATVNFPSSAKGKRLNYNFYIRTPDQTMTERMKRQLGIREKDIELNATYFNSFAW